MAAELSGERDGAPRLVIRKEQVRALRAYMLRSFENRLVAHLGKYFPEPCGRLGERGVREAVRYGIQCAGIYGIVAERDVCKYLNLMFTFGRDFDTDPRLPWAAEALRSTLAATPTERLERLYDRAIERAGEARGAFARRDD